MGRATISLRGRLAPHPGARLRFGGEMWDGEALAAWATGEARALAGMGVEAGDRVAVLAQNDPRTLALLFACAQLGAMLVPLNWRLAGPELDWILGDAAPRVLFTDGSVTVSAREGTRVVAMGARAEVAEGVEEDGGVGQDPGAGVLLVYTSGTTGRPKGAVLSGAALLANAALAMDMLGLTADDHALTVLPLFHVGGLNIQTVPLLLLGGTVTLLRRFEAGAALEAIGRERPSMTVLVPATLQAVYADAGWAGAALGSLRLVATGSTVVQPAVVAPMVARGVPVLQVYGSTETAPVAIYTKLGMGYAATSTGHVGPGCEARAVDGAGREVADGVAGEILLRGKQLFSGYWRNPAATAEAMAGGWYHTGDVGTRGADGSWTVHDRVKNLIVSGGENIYPAEVERVLHEMPQVAEAAVVGVADARWQEVPEAHVVLRAGAACSEAEVIAHVHGQLARFKAPRRVHFVGSLPRNAMGKVEYGRLKAARC